MIPNPYLIDCVTPDSANNRLFVLANDIQSDKELLLVYALPALTLQGVANLSGVGDAGFDGTGPVRLILWGSQGIALNQNGVSILAGSFSAPGSGSAPQVVRHAAAQTLRSVFIAGSASRL